LAVSTDIIIAELRGEVISTLSLVRDGDLGLPLESIYPEIVRRRRQQGIRLAEVSCLADRRQEPARYFGLFSELAGLMVQMADREGLEQLLITVHPRHARLYCRAMAFQIIGDHCDYPAVNGNPAVPLCLDIDYVKTKQPQIWARFAGASLPEAVLQRRPIVPVDHAYFLDLARQSNCPCAAHAVSLSTFSELALT
jgi:hypothetical protein